MFDSRVDAATIVHGARHASLIDQGPTVDAVTVSQRFQITIPLRVRRALGIKPGQKLHVILYQNRIELIPVIPARQVRGFLKGIDTTIDREEDRV